MARKVFCIFTRAIYGIFILFSTVFLFYFILFARAIYLDDQNKHRTKQGKQGTEEMTMAMAKTTKNKINNNQQIETQNDVTRRGEEAKVNK